MTVWLDFNCWCVLSFNTSEIGEGDEQRGEEMKERKEEACQDLSGPVGTLENW